MESTEADSNIKNMCKLCHTSIGKYVCPKCNILYCSLSCYRSRDHQDCSEQFYKDSVLKELKLNENNPEDRLKMLSILKANMDKSEISELPECVDDDSLTESYDSDDEVIQSLQERLAGVDLDNPEQVWDQLDEDERKEFIALIQDYKSKNLEENWKPWWTHSYNTKVQEINADLSVYKSKCPTVIDTSKYSNICKKDVHISVEYNLHNILAGYVFVTRYFNGEYSLFPKETMSFLSIVSESLGSHQNFEDSATAVKSVEKQITENDWIKCGSDNLSDDFVKIISGPVKNDPNYYIIASLSDIHTLLKKSVCKGNEEKSDALSRAFVDEHFPASKNRTMKELKLYIKRIEFFLSYVHNSYMK